MDLNPPALSTGPFNSNNLQNLVIPPLYTCHTQVVIARPQTVSSHQLLIIQLTTLPSSFALQRRVHLNLFWLSEFHVSALHH